MAIDTGSRSAELRGDVLGALLQIDNSKQQWQRTRMRLRPAAIAPQRDCIGADTSYRAQFRCREILGGPGRIRTCVAI